jgi:fucose 4-O-acetylase-like acetyltransferase
MTTRNIWIDVARGVGIILVVYGHVLRGLDSRGLIVGEWAQVHDDVIYSFHMPLFFFLSGLLVARGLDRNRSQFLIGKIPTLIFPYLLWSVIQTVLAHSFSPGTQTDVGLPALAQMHLEPIAEFWFLYALLICHIILALFWRSKLVLIALAMLGLAGISLPLPVIFSVALSHFPYVVAGLCVAPLLLNETGVFKEAMTLRAAFVVALSLFFALLISNRDIFTMATKITAHLSAFVGIAFVVGISMLWARRLSWLAPIGRASMAIYLMHTLAIGVVRAVALKLGFVSTLPLVFGLTIVGVAIPMMIYILASRYKFALWLGLGRGDSTYLDVPLKGAMAT